MSGAPSQQDAGHVSVENNDEQIAKKRPKLTFINPAEWEGLQARGSGAHVIDPDMKLCQRFIDRQTKSLREEGKSLIF